MSRALLDRKHTNVVLFATDGGATTKPDKADVPQEILDQVQGTLYYKQIAAFGKWVNPLFPVESMTLDKAWAQSIVDNFNADPKLVDNVPIPRNHTDDVSANTGEVIGLNIEADGLYGWLDVRDWSTSSDIDGGLIFDDSISFDWDFVDTKTGDTHGPTLLHVALVNNPYLTGMKPFDKVIDDDPLVGMIDYLSKDIAPNRNASVIMLSATKAKELIAMSKTATVKNKQDFPVEISVKDEDGEVVKHTLKPGEEVPVPEDQSEAVNQQINEAKAPETDPEETAEEKAAREQKEADDAAEAAKQGAVNETEKEELARLRKERTDLSVDKAYTTLLSQGKITPAQKDKFMELSKLSASTVQLSGKPVDVVELLSGILNAGPKIVSLDKEDGTNKGKTDEEIAAEKKAAEEAEANKKPSERLSDSDRRGLEATGTSPEELDALAEKHPEMRKQLDELDTKREKKES